MQNDMQLLSVTPSVVWTGTALVCRRNRKISGMDLISSWTFGVRTALLHNHVSVYSMQGNMTSMPPVVKKEWRMTNKYSWQPFSCYHPASGQIFVHSPDGNKKKVAKSIYLSFFIPSLQLEALRSYSPAWNTLKHGYATAQFSPQKFMKRSSPFLKSFGFVYILMRSQSKLHLGLLTEVAYRSAFRRQRLITVLVV